MKTAKTWGIAPWATTGLLAALAAGPVLELYERSSVYHGSIGVPSLDSGWMSFPGSPKSRDSADVQYVWWRQNAHLTILTIMIMILFARGIDFLMVRSGIVNVLWAQRIHLGVDLILSSLFLWKIYGFYWWVVAAHALSCYVIVVVGRRFTSRPARLLFLALLWAVNVGFILDSRNAQNLISDFLEPYEKIVRGHIITRLLYRVMLNPGQMQWHSNIRFGLFRTIDFGTSELLRDPEPPASNGRSESARKRAIPEWLSFLRYATYAPLVWQGPLIGFRTFNIQSQRRYREVDGRLSVLPIPWRKVGKLTIKLVISIFLRELLDHHFFASMFLKREIHFQFRSGEMIVTAFIYLTSSYTRMLITWRVFQLWALLDNVEVIDNFPHCLFRNTSVGDMWRNTNASVHVWILGNVYGPICEVFKFHHRWGVVATFVFMAVWHGLDTSWIYFATLNCVIILLEQACSESDLIQSIMRRFNRATQLLITSFSWTLRVLLLWFTWMNFKSIRDDQISFLRPRQIFGRAFLDDTVESEIAEKFNIDNHIRLLDRALFGGLVPYPTQVLVGTILCFMSIRILVYFYDEYPTANHSSANLREKIHQNSDDEIAHHAATSFDNRMHKRFREIASQNSQSLRMHAQTICQVLTWRAEDHPDEPAAVWLKDEKGKNTLSFTFGDLYHHSVNLAWDLIHKYDVLPGDRVVLVFSPGLEFMVGLFACMYAGAIAVPVYPPNPQDTSRDLVFQGILKDCEPKIILSDNSYMFVRRLGQAVNVAKKMLAALRVLFGVAVPMTVAMLLQSIKLSMKQVYPRRYIYIPDAEWREPEEPSLPSHPLEYALVVGALVTSIWCVDFRDVMGDKREPKVPMSYARIPWVQVQPFSFWHKIKNHFSHSRGSQAMKREPPECTPADDPSAVAYLQYTSGSTGTPKGVCITHENIMDQGHSNQVAFGCLGRGETAVNWCPQYHDLGLVVCTLSGLYAGIRLVSFSPLVFLRNPLLWVQTVSKYSANFSAAPNFAYAYTARKARAALAAGESLEGLNLSSWRVAGNGGEPVRAKALEEFASVFSRFGFASEAAFPCFGLAEHTIMVSGRRDFRKPTYLSVSNHALSMHRVEIISERQDANMDSDDSLTLVGCGEPYENVQVLIVDPKTQLMLSDPTREVGEIWLASPSVAAGYWGMAEHENAKVFEARPHNYTFNASFLRTGDLGFLWNGELYICGRCKDLIIIDGRNIYPQDIEATAEQAVSLLRPGSSAAFTQDQRGLCLVVELRRESSEVGIPKIKKLCSIVHQHVLKEQRVSVSELIVVKSGTLPKTSSGKIRRRAVADMVNQQDPKLFGSVKYRGCAKDFIDSEGDSSEAGMYIVDDLLDDPTYTAIVECILSSAPEDAHFVASRRLQKEDDEDEWYAAEKERRMKKMITIKEIEAAYKESILHKTLDEILSPSSGKNSSSFSSLEAVQFAATLQKKLELRGIDVKLPPDVAFCHPSVGALALYIYDADA